jgi:hypothetical protein
MGPETAARRSGGASGGTAGVIWMIGWLFTIGFARLVWWKILVGLLVWPYFLGTAIR